MIEDKVMEEQAGLRRGRGCAEQIFVMRQLAAKMIERAKGCMQGLWTHRCCKRNNGALGTFVQRPF